MTTFTIKVNKKTKAGKAFMTMTDTFFKDAVGVEIVENPEKESKMKTLNQVSIQSMDNTSNGIGLTKTKSHHDLMEKLFS